jgi:hypothetical protein
VVVGFGVPVAPADGGCGSGEKRLDLVDHDGGLRLLDYRRLGLL